MFVTSLLGVFMNYSRSGVIQASYGAYILQTVNEKIFLETFSSQIKNETYKHTNWAVNFIVLEFFAICRFFEYR